MSEPEQKIERHSELWKQGSKGLGRLVIGMVVFAILIVFKVFTPLVDDSLELSEQKTQLQRVKGDLESIEEENARLAPVEERLKKIHQKIQDEPWFYHRNRLVDQIKWLNETFERLPRSPEGLKKALFDEFYAQNSSTSISDTLESLGPRGKELAEASRESYQELLNKLYRENVQKVANIAIKEIEHSVQEHVVKLFESSAGDTSAVNLRGIADAFRKDLEKWSNDHLGKEEWYQTIRGKDRELGKLTSILMQRQQEFLSPIQTKLAALDEKKKPLIKQETELKEEQNKLTGQIKSLEDRLETILPFWARGMVSTTEMLQLFPLALIVLVIFVAYRVWRVRAHFLIVRLNHEPPDLSFRDAAMSSVWTLVWRGYFGTTLTSLAYIGGCALIWWLFEHGVIELTTWLGTDAKDAFLSDGHVTVTKWLGRLTFCLAILGTSYVLLRELWMVTSSINSGDRDR